MKPFIHATGRALPGTVIDSLSVAISMTRRSIGTTTGPQSPSVFRIELEQRGFHFVDALFEFGEFFLFVGISGIGFFAQQVASQFGFGDRKAEMVQRRLSFEAIS